MRNEPIDVGVIGYGYWGPNLARNFFHNSRFRLVSIADSDPARAAKAKRDYPGLHVTDDGHSLVRDDQVKLLAIASSASTHYQIAKEALRADKHVLVSKPMTSSVSQAAELCELAESKRLTLAVDHTFLFTPAVNKIKQLSLEGSLGDLYYFDAKRINLGLFQPDVNVLWDLAIHDLSILLHVYTDRPIAVSAIGTSHLAGTPANTAYLSLFYPSGAIANIHVSWFSPVKIRQLLMACSRRMIMYDDMETSEKLRVYDRGADLASKDLRSEVSETKYQTLVNYRDGDMYSPSLPNAEALSIELNHLADCILDGAKPISDGWLGYSLVCILAAATQSMVEDGRRIRLRSLSKMIATDTALVCT